jgi:hypothetical protein
MTYTLLKKEHLITSLHLVKKIAEILQLGLFLHGAVAPQWAKASSLSRLHHHTQDTQHSVGLLWTSDRSPAETSTWQHRHSEETDIHAPGGIRILNPSKWTAADQRLKTARPLGSITKPIPIHKHTTDIYIFIYLFMKEKRKGCDCSNTYRVINTTRHSH